MDDVLAGGPATWFEGLELLDVTGLFVVGLLVVLGLARGLWWQVIRLLGVALAVAVARTWDQDVGSLISDRWPELAPRLALGIAWLSLFLCGLFLATLFGRFGASLLDALKLGLINRVAGGLLGAATGILLHVTLLVGLCQFATQSFLTEHVAGTWSERLVHTLVVDRPIVLGAASGATIEGTMERAQSQPPLVSEPSDAPADDGRDERPIVR